MDTQIELAKHRLFAVDELNAADIKLFPGSTRDSTPEQIAEQVNKAIAQIMNGEYELLSDDND
ncbi:MAG TPA: hypothetical protein VIL88_14805 [Devosia sp.]|jgi:hypothetical protein|uniref:hypothetical protein n=1 Tax=Devosia sp. TaxID=1871048 RepID=UPI002F94760F